MYIFIRAFMWYVGVLLVYGTCILIEIEIAPQLK